LDGRRLSVIVINYNAGPMLRDCLLSLAGQLRHRDEVLVIDNNSSDGSDRDLEGTCPGLSVVHSPRNLGFAAAVNLGTATTSSGYVLLLNPDARLAPGALDIAITHLEENPDVGILGGRVVLPDGRVDPSSHRSFKTPTTYFYKFTGLTAMFPRSPRFGRYYLSYIDKHAVADVDAVVGAFMLVRRSLIDQMGPMDETFFMYCEDEDWCWRAKQHGSRVVYHPGVVVHHLKGGSAMHRPFQSIYHWHRSIAQYHRKNIAGRYPAPVNAAVYVGIGVGLLVALVRQSGRSGLHRVRAAPGRGRRSPEASEVLPHQTETLN
jgi:GT2 family glycosyltransferase